MKLSDYIRMGLDKSIPDYSFAGLVHSFGLSDIGNNNTQVARDGQIMQVQLSMQQNRRFTRVCMDWFLSYASHTIAMIAVVPGCISTSDSGLCRIRLHGVRMGNQLLY